MKCPKCDEELNYDEVDIGVGLMKGNYHCDACGWSDRDDIVSTCQGGLLIKDLQNWDSLDLKPKLGDKLRGE